MQVNFVSFVTTVIIKIKNSAREYCIFCICHLLHTAHLYHQLFLLACILTFCQSVYRHSWISEVSYQQLNSKWNSWDPFLPSFLFQKCPLQVSRFSFNKRLSESFYDVKCWNVNYYVKCSSENCWFLVCCFFSAI